MLLRSASAAQSFDSNPSGVPLAKVLTYLEFMRFIKGIRRADFSKEALSRLVSIQLTDTQCYCAEPNEPNGGSRGMILYGSEHTPLTA
jgi:hypothetical protein